MRTLLLQVNSKFCGTAINELTPLRIGVFSLGRLGKRSYRFLEQPTVLPIP